MSDMILIHIRRLIKRWANDRLLALSMMIILAFFVRIGTCILLRTYQFSHDQNYWAFGFEWGRIARWLVDAHMYTLDGISPTAITDPLYTFIIAFFFYLFGPFSTNAAFALIFFQSLLYSLCTWQIFTLAENIYGPLEARLSALLFACYPAAIFFATVRIDPSGLSVLLSSLIFLSFLAFQDSKEQKFAVLGGTLMGLLVLTSSKCLSLLLVIPLWLFLMNKGHRIRMIIPSLIFIGFAALIVLPWSLRNSIVFGEVSISRGALGYHVWAGNNPHATGYSDQIDPANNPIAGKFPEKDGSFTGILSDPHQAAYLESHTSAYLGLAMSWIKDNPRDFVLLTLKRVKYFWYQIPRANISKGELLNTWILVVMEVLAMVGVFWSRDNIERTSLLMLFLLFFPVLFYLTHVVYYRHRFHVEPFLLIIASHGCICLWEKILRRFPIGLVARR